MADLVSLPIHLKLPFTSSHTPVGDSLLLDSLGGVQKEGPAIAPLATGRRQTMIHT